LYLPLRSDQYDSMAGLLPVFEMNLPEGALRERLRLQFAKSRGRNEREAKAIAHVLSGPPVVDSMRRGAACLDGRERSCYRRPQ
jgi:hypothetical protein